MLATLVTLRPRLLTHCRADLDRSGSLDIFDFLLFQTMFTRADPAADLNLDTRFDIFDFLVYQDLYARGCS